MSRETRERVRTVKYAMKYSICNELRLCGARVQISLPNQHEQTSAEKLNNLRKAISADAVHAQRSGLQAALVYNKRL